MGKKRRRLHERDSPRTEKMKMEKMEKMRHLNGRGTPELQNVGGKWKLEWILLWENGKNWKNKTNSGVSKCASIFPFFLSTLKNNVPPLSHIDRPKPSTIYKILARRGGNKPVKLHPRPPHDLYNIYSIWKVLRVKR